MNPASWDRQAVRIVPPVAAALFGLELGILGPVGAILPVTDITGPRVSDPHGRPFLLVQVGDRQFVPASSLLTGAPGAAPAQPGANPWTEPLTPQALLLASQEGISAPLPPGAADSVAVGRVAELRHLAETGRRMTSVPGEYTERVRDHIRLLLSRPGTAAGTVGGGAARVRRHSRRA